MSSIPIHLLHERAESGVVVEYFQPGDITDEKDTLGVHRDDHYIFFVLESGGARLMIDFQKIDFRQACLYFVLPGQVHHRISSEISSGWFVAVDTGLLMETQRQVFEERLILQQPVLLNEVDLNRFNQVLWPLRNHFCEQTGHPFYRQILYSLLQAFTGMVAAQYQAAECTGVLPSRKVQLTRAFRTLLSQQMKEVKSPSAYAEMLHVSPAYLNEALKQTTGLPVSYWITQEVMLEAKRLLYYTPDNVKEIAHELGYDDHTYFSRLFKQHNGITPLAFRSQYRE